MKPDSLTAGRRAAAFTLLLGLSSCMHLSYDLSSVPVPVSAQPATAEGVAEPFERRAKHTLFAHGLFGRQRPDVARMVAEEAEGAREIADLRVTQAGSFHDWLITHLSLTLVRMKTVTVSGERVR